MLSIHNDAKKYTHFLNQFSNFACHYQIPVTDCSVVEIPVPSQPKLHKQWCLFDQAENIDFDTEVKKIEKKQKNVKSETGDQVLFEDYDLRFPEKIAIDQLFEDTSEIQSVGGFTHLDFKPRYKKKRHIKNLQVPKPMKNNHVPAQTKIGRVSKHVSHQ